jgi:RNA polymerase sigma factor (TIGR02999 family)
MTDSTQLTVLLQELRDGNPDAREKLWPHVYDELRRLAGHHMRDQRPGHTLQATALIHEAYMRLIDTPISGESRAEFFALAAKAMRSILIDYARGKARAKRGAGAVKVSLDEAMLVRDTDQHELLALDQALERLADLDERKAEIVELRYFGGLTLDEIAGVTGISEPTVRRDLRLARAWLRHSMSEGPPSSPPGGEQENGPG